MTFAELVVKFKSEGSESVKKDVADVGNSVKGAAKSAALMGGVAGIASSAIEALGSALYAAGKAAVDATVEFDSNIRALAVYSKNSAELSAQMARLKELAKAPGLGLSELMLGVARLRGAGISAKTAEAAMKQFGNAIALSGGGKAQLEGVALALQQIAAKGKVSAEEINQIAERAPQVRQAMKKAFGTADAEELAKKGIGPKQFFEGITKAMEDLPRASGGLQNMIDNIKDDMKDALVVIGSGFKELFSGAGGAGAIEGISSLISGAAQTFYETMVGIAKSEAFISIKNSFASIIKSMQNMAPVFGAIWKFLVATIVVTLDRLLKQVAAIANFVGLLFKAPVKTILNEFYTLGEQIRAIFINVGVGILTAIKWVASQIDKVTGSKLAAQISPGSYVKVPGPSAGQKAVMASAGAFNVNSASKSYATIMGSNAKYDAVKGIPTGGGGADKGGLSDAVASGTDKANKKDKDKKEKQHKELKDSAAKQQKSLERIADHTKAAEMSLREFSYGGGVMGGKVLSKSDLYAKSINAPLTSWNTDLDKGITKLIRSYSNNNNLNLNFRRA